jgi:uncharacterized repeat protein (TIGR03803 family)
MNDFRSFGWILSTVLLFLADRANGQIFTNLHSFGGGDGASPDCALVQGSDGNFYGTTSAGGSGNVGTVFRISPSASFSNLHSFSGSDGNGPHADLVQGSDSNFYGTTWYGGASNSGTVFRISPSGSFTNLRSFSGNDGAYANSLAQGADGNFYGTTSAGGANNSGTVFRISAGGAFSNLYSFSSNEGAIPYAGVVQGSDGNFYGTTRHGGASKGGGVFRISASGILTNLYSFDGSAGARPVAELAQGNDGNFYGTTSAGAIGNNGAVFRISPSGNVTNLHSFTGSDGANPNTRLFLGSDGSFYGVAGGGASGAGTIFRIRPNGTFTNLYSFSGSDGNGPVGLVQASDGSFYGMTSSGGNLGQGLVFRFSVSPDTGQVFFVTSTSDSGPGSLRQAISDANSSGGGTILFSGVAGIITLTSGEMVLSTNLTIDASAVPGGITINGNQAGRVFNVAGGTVVMNALTITNAYQVYGDGGAILNSGSLTLNRCTLTGNDAIGGAGGNGGGAIANEAGGNLTVNECTFAGNLTGKWGGGIENLGTLTVNQCTFTLNYSVQGGGGIDHYGNSLVLAGTILAGNTCLYSPPDLFMESGLLTVSYCLIGDGTDSSVANGVNGNLVGTGVAPINALLGPLGDYGGPTPTMPLTRGSPAIDAGGSTTFATDQRGFPRFVGLAPDMGAYESGTKSNYNVWIWESLPATATVAQHGATFDFDGDGQSNSNEWLAGSDPNDANSAFRITAITRQGNNLGLTWMTGIGRTNALQAATAAGDGGYYTNGFTDIFTVTNTVGTTTNYLDVGAATNIPSRFYRVRLVP